MPQISERLRAGPRTGGQAMATVRSLWASKRTVLVASPGGHLDELRLLVDQLGIDAGNAVWVSSRTPQTESALADANVVWVPHIGSGERLRPALGLPRALRLQRILRPDRVVSTGAALAVPHLAAASLTGCESWFIDSATRLSGPSATGRFAERLPHTRLFVQGPGWGDPSWTQIPGVFDAFESHAVTPPRGWAGIRSVVVALGSEAWPFPRAAARVLALLPDAEIVWQTGNTRVRHRGRLLQQWLPAGELREAMRAADVVVTHGGVGSALAALDVGKVPVFLPRRPSLGEHVDDHQSEAARALARRSLVVAADPDELTGADLLRAATMVASRRIRHRALQDQRRATAVEA